MGLLFGELISFSVEWIFLVFVLTSLFVWFFLKNKGLTISVFAFAIALLGAELVQLVRNNANELSAGTHSRIAVVEEAGQSDKVWKKHIIRVEREGKNDSKDKSNWKFTDQQVLIYSQHQFREGDVILFRSELETIRNSGNPGEFDARSYWKSKNISMMAFVGASDFTLIDYESPHWMTQVFRDTRNYLSKLLSASLPEKEASLARALVLGDKSKLSGETRESFGNAGAMHVLAISGLHVGIIMYLLFFILKSTHRWISRTTAVIITLLFLWIFAGVTGWSPSVLRSTLMFSLLLLGQQWARSGSPLNTLFFSALVLLLINPLLVFDIGFQLSYGAMMGIFIFFDRVQALVKVRGYILRKAWEGTALGISAQMFTIPIVLYHFHQFPNYFWLTNLGIMCLAGVILGTSLIFFALHYVPYLPVLLSIVLGWSLFALLKFVEWIDSLPFGVATGFDLHPSEVIVFIGLMLLLVSFYRRKILRYISIAILLFVVGSWQWHRYESKVDKEIVIFNSNSPVIAVKSGDKIRAFYSGKIEKADRLMKAYSKVKPGTYNLDSLRMGKTTVQLSKTRIEIEKSDEGIRLKNGNRSVYLRLRYSAPEEKTNFVLDMPYLESPKGYYNLSKGAFRLEL